jgi:serine/threonine protein kinase
MKEIYLLSSFAKLGKNAPFLQFYDYLLVKNNLLIMMEFYPGKELYDVYRKLSTKDTLQTFKTLIDAVYQMHSCDIVHTDLHLGNILYKNPTDIKIIDMGRSQCYTNTGHKFCNEDNKMDIYSYARGFSKHYQIAPWRKRQCYGKGCSKEELMAGDLWSICYPSANKEDRKRLEDLYVDQEWSGRDFLDFLQDTYDRICVSMGSGLADSELPDKITELYNIEDSF